MVFAETAYTWRKKVTREGYGPLRHWMQAHVFAGLVGPYLVLLHTAFQFRGLAGVLALMVLVVVASGVVGRFAYTAVPKVPSARRARGGCSPSGGCCTCPSPRPCSCWPPCTWPARCTTPPSCADPPVRFSSSLTRWALGAAAVAAVAVLAAWVATGGGVLSPGRLHAGRAGGGTMGGVASHAELSRQCAKCHAPPLGDGRMADRCLACHVDVRAELGDSAQLHGILPDGSQCLRCHVEHRGPTAVLTDFSGEGFAHERLGFSLAAHRELAGGGAVHLLQLPRGGNLPLRRGALRAVPRATTRRRSRPRTCGTGGAPAPPATTAWTASPPSATTRVAFRLTGRHVPVPCASCHTPVRALAAFADAPATCVGCHRAGRSAPRPVRHRLRRLPQPRRLERRGLRPHLPAGPRGRGRDRVPHLPPGDAQLPHLHLLRLPRRAGDAGRAHRRRVPRHRQLRRLPRHRP